MLHAQTDTSIFASQKRVEVAEYIFSVPERWKAIPQIDATSKDRKFEFTGVSLPETVNNAPLTANFMLRKFVCDSLPVAEDYIISEFTTFPDRVTPAGYNYERDTTHILSGEKARLYYTHYYRRSKAFNFSRMDMIVYSKKRKAAYMLTAIFQYKDPTYATENKLLLRAYVLRVFKSLLLR
jgi:hypothetical protein